MNKAELGQIIFSLQNRWFLLRQKAIEDRNRSGLKKDKKFHWVLGKEQDEKDDKSREGDPGERMEDKEQKRQREVGGGGQAAVVGRAGFRAT